MLTRLLPPTGARLLTVITMVMSLGQGLWMAISAIYAVTVLGLSPAQFGISVGVIAAIVLLSSPPLGHLADRLGPRGVQMWSFLALGPLTAALVLAQGFWSYLTIMSVQGLFYRAANNARKAMIAGLVPRAERVGVLAYIRAAINVTIAIGAGIAGLVIAADAVPAYKAAVIFTAAAFVVTGLLTALERPVPPVPASAGAALAVMRDVPFLVFTVLDGLLVTHALLLDVVLPLWVIHHTDAPRWASAGLIVLNTCVVVALQTRAARGTHDPHSAARASLQGALCVSLACGAFALSGGDRGMWVAVACLVAGALLHALGEIRHAAGSWTIAYDLAPDHAQGQYQGTHKMGGDVGKMFAPAVFTWLLIEQGAVGWLGVAAVWAVLGAAMPAVVRYAVGSRLRQPESVTTGDLALSSTRTRTHP